MTDSMSKLINQLKQIPEPEQEIIAKELLWKLQSLRSGKPKPLKQVIGSGKGLYKNPEQVDTHINQLRDEWGY